jgi:L-threonylcarbamoyladenylate synthase
MEKAILALKAGGVILHKTDTVWGLACDARNEAAVQKMKTR